MKLTKPSRHYHGQITVLWSLWMLRHDGVIKSV